MLWAVDSVLCAELCYGDKADTARGHSSTSTGCSAAAAPLMLAL
jgi:hypothetical protein